MDYLLSLRDKVDEYKLSGKSAFTQEEYMKAKNEYLKLLDKWDEEYSIKADKKRKYIMGV